MGFFGFLNDNPVPKRTIAQNLAEQIGLLEECPVCRAIVDADQPALLKKADALVQQLIDRGDPSIECFAGDAQALKTLIRQVVEEADLECRCD